MKSIKQKTVDAAAKIIMKMGEWEFLGWPPLCAGTFYQPERPQTLAKQEDSVVEENKKAFR